MIISAQGGTPVYVTLGFDPDWSPDGEWLAFARGDWYLADIVLRNLDSGDGVTLVSNGMPNSAPGWRPR